jgi:hypothetical protein
LFFKNTAIFMPRCQNCNQEIDEPANIKPEDRLPCTNCASTSRALSISVHEVVHIHEMLNLKGRQGTGGRPLMEQRVGDDLHRKTGRWLKIERVIDRIKDWYKELITDPETGKAIHHTEERLSDHIGHGSAKDKSTN